VAQQTYRVNVKLRRHHQTALDNHRAEFKTEEFDDDESLCMAIASELLEMLRDDRDYLNDQEGDEDNAD
jgi:hypothetical protein